MTGLSVLIVSYRTPELTVAAVESALAADPRSEVLVVDNASGDRSVSLLRDLNDERIRLIVNRSNVGYGAAANQAASHSHGDVLVFLNSDARLSAAALHALVQEVTRHGGRCIAAARLIGADGEVQRSAGLLPRPLDLAVRALGLNRIGARAARWPTVGRFVRRSALLREYESAAEAIEPIDTSMVSGACCAMGRNAFEELGGFDERFFLYFEDADLCRRALKAGIALRYVPSAVVTHIGGASSEGDYHFSPMHARSMRQYLEKWWGSAGATLAILLLWLRLLGHATTLHPETGKAFAALRAALR